MFKSVMNKVATAKNTVMAAALIAMTDIASASSGGADASLQKVGGTMTTFLRILPTGAKIAGVIVMIGGMWSMYSHYKSGGRDGSIAAGIAGIFIGAGLFFLSGMLQLGGDTIGVSGANNALIQ